MPNDQGIKMKILEEAHNTAYSVHPGSTKMTHDLKALHWWPRMKKDIAKFVAKCLTCQQVKVEHQQPAITLQPLEIPEWKWEDIAMDFVKGLPRTTKQLDSVWVTVDRLTKICSLLASKNNLQR